MYIVPVWIYIYLGGGGCIHVYMSLVKLSVWYFGSAEYAVRAHVAVLAWDRKSLSWGPWKKNKHGCRFGNLQARLYSCSRSNISAAFLYLINTMYWRYERSLRMVESRCAASLLGSVICCAEGGRFIPLYMRSRFTSWISSSIAFLDDLSCMCSIKDGWGMLKIILVCPSSIRGTLSVETSFRSIVRPSAKSLT